MPAAGEPETVAVKQWLRELRTERGLTQKELAAAMDVTTRVVINAESATGGLPSGLPFLRMLRELGVVQDSPSTEAPSLTVRLAALEADVREVVRLVTRALELLDDPQASGVPQSQRIAE